MMGTFRALCRRGHSAGVDQTQASFLAQIYLGVALFPVHCSHRHCMEARGHLQRDIGKRPREGRAGRGGDGRSSATIPWVLDNPEIGISIPVTHV